MNKKTIMGPYEWLEDANYWISREKVIEGTVRKIEGKLCYAEPYRLYYDEPTYSMASCRNEEYENVISWLEV